MKGYLAALIAVFAGIVVTLATGFIVNMPAQLVGATYYGYPLAWLHRLVLAPGYYPWRFNAIIFVLDVAFWALVSAAILFVVTRIRGSNGTASD